MKDIHSYLGNRKIRGWILFPPMFLLVVGMLIGFCAIIFKFTVPPVVLPVYLFVSVYFVIGLTTILWSDLKRLKK